MTRYSPKIVVSFEAKTPLRQNTTAGPIQGFSFPGDSTLMHTLHRVSKLAAVSATCLSVLWGVAVTLPSRADTYLEETGTITPAKPLTPLREPRDKPLPLPSRAKSSTLCYLYSTRGATKSQRTMTLAVPSIPPSFSPCPPPITILLLPGLILARGGDYSLKVRSSTPYEVSYAEAQALAMEEDYPAAIDAYTSAISLDPDQPSAYLGRAEAYLGQVYLEQGTQIQGPEDIPATAREAIIADFEAAAALSRSLGSARLGRLPQGTSRLFKNWRATRPGIGPAPRHHLFCTFSMTGRRGTAGIGR